MGHESIAMKAAAAQTAFVVAAVRELPPEAFQDLLSRRPDEVTTWAVQWRVNAPCMIDYATALREWAARASQDDTFAQGVRQKSLGVVWSLGGEMSEAARRWRVELARLDSFPISPFPALIPANLNTEKEQRESRPGEPPEPEDDPEANAYVRDVLAPLSADPSIESQGDFFRRAEQHYVARALRLERLGAERVSPPSHELTKHVGWLVRWHMKGESYRQIFESEKLIAGRDTIRMAVKRLVRLVGLEARKPAGRPRKGAAELRTSE